MSSKLSECPTLIKFLEMVLLDFQRLVEVKPASLFILPKKFIRSAFSYKC